MRPPHSCTSVKRRCDAGRTRGVCDVTALGSGESGDSGATTFCPFSKASTLSTAQPEAEPRLNSSLDTRASFTITRGDHLCGFYSSDIGRISLALPFLLDGLNEGSVCFLIGPLRARAKIIKHLKKQRRSLQADIEAATLIPSEHHDSPRAQYTYFRKIMEKRASADAHSFRVFGDMWGLRSKISQGSLIEFEALYDRLIARKYPVATLCIYDVRRFSGVEVLEALKGHRDTFRHPLEKALA